MKINIRAYKDRDGTQVVKGWWGESKIRYVADDDKWSLWVSDGAKIDTNQSPADRGQFGSEEVEVDNMTLEVAIDNIQKVFRNHYWWGR